MNAIVHKLWSRWYLLLFLPVAAALLFLPKLWVLAAAGVIAACMLAVFIAASVLHGRVEDLVLGWVLVFPLGYYFLTFPRERSIFTLDRAFIALLLVAIVFRSRRQAFPLPLPLREAGIAWALFLAAALVSVRLAANPLGNAKELLDVFALPAVFAWYVVRDFPVRKHLAALHHLICLMTVYVAAIGFVEMVTGQDLMPFPTGIFLIEDTGFARVNGPFATNNSFGLIGLLSFYLLLFLGRALGTRMRVWERGLHAVGLISALTIAVLPMFRSMLVTLALILIIEFFLNKKFAVRATVAGMVLLAGLGFLVFKRRAPAVFEYRVSDPSDIYARIAQQRQTLDLFRTHPIGGVGWGDYMEVAYDSSDVSYNGVSSVGSAHNTIGAVLVETGLSGFLPFVAAQFLLLRVFWRLRRRGGHDARLASTLFLYVFLSYWITGVSLTSGYYSDVNMWYLFVVAVLYKFAVTEPLPTVQPHRHSHSLETRTPVRRRLVPA